MTKQTETQSKRAEQLERELQLFTGDLVRIRHPLNRSVIYTPGVKHLAEKAEAYWLVDAIASWIGSPEFIEAGESSPAILEWHAWELNVDQANCSATLHAEQDSYIEPFIVQSIGFTDLPLEKIQIWAGFDGEHWTLYLPSEH